MSNDINENIKRLIDKLNISALEFSKQIGNNRADNIYNVINGKVKISPVTLDKIFKRYPEWKDFVLYGEDHKSDKKQEETRPELAEPKETYSPQPGPVPDLVAYLREKDAKIDEKEKEIRQLIKRIAHLEAKLEAAKKGGYCLEEKESDAECAGAS